MFAALLRLSFLSSNPLSYAVSLVSFGLRERPTVFKPINIERNFFKEKNLLDEGKVKQWEFGSLSARSADFWAF